MPKVSVCIPTYNRQDLLPLAMDSVICQTYPDWELIICDDGSTDQTPDILAQYKDDRIRYIRHPQNIGKSNNMRSGFDAATGDYFIKFDDDDRLTPEFLAKTVAILENNPQVDFVGTDHWLINIYNERDKEATTLNSRYWGRENRPEGIIDNLLEVVFVKQVFQIGATLFRRQALIDINYMRPNLQNCEDNDLLVRLALDQKTGYYLPEYLMEYRVHGGQEGNDRAIRYLEDKASYLDYFNFDSEKLENIRKSRLGAVQLNLGLRFIETGQDEKGRHYLNAAQNTIGTTKKSQLGLILSYLPLKLRQWLFKTARNIQSPDYSQQMRQAK
ncbi:glycosyltransferase family 2 protein [Spirulina sp. CS-785/01]|uniref:glycosyltransferase family 2 protein n=1 Tax=Spirulina sp. CS-785/01 TaxID=3021716 RepID=UPI00232E82A2|nr:glycosyltransferase family 2 protein [Spirulina sp. CS-785/01]MDB9312997.1 glycosyltransferase family 2 protein [Spirulina sp. CS-785/01]